MLNTLRKQILAALALMVGLLLNTTAANATLAGDLQNLNTQASAVNSYMSSITLDGDTVCGPLLEANNQLRDLVNSIEQVDSSLAAPLQVDADVMDALDNLFITSSSLADEALRLSVDIDGLSTVASAITIKDGITAMLQLSDDIGTMADRIGTMADNILIMSDNIGTMADRILLTQQLQNQNVALTTQSILQTQSNMLTLVSTFETASYNLSFNTLAVDGEALAARMALVTLHPWTMDDQLRDVVTDVNSFLLQVKTVYDSLDADSLTGTAYVSSDTLTKLANLPLVLDSIATAVDGYVIAIDGLQGTTSDSTLYDSMKSMLTLSADIGLMADRILEMADVILAMSDNIGLQADQIVSTQEAMNIEIVTTQSSMLAAQEMAIDIITLRNLD